MTHFRTLALVAPCALLLALAVGCSEEPEPAAPAPAAETAATAPEASPPVPAETAPPRAQETPAAERTAPAAAPGLATQMPAHSEEFIEKVQDFQTLLTDQAEAAYAAELEECGKLAGQAAEDCRRGALLRFQSQQETIEVRVHGLMSRKPERTSPRR